MARHGSHIPDDDTESWIFILFQIWCFSVFKYVVNTSVSLSIKFPMKQTDSGQCNTLSYI